MHHDDGGCRPSRLSALRAPSRFSALAAPAGLAALSARTPGLDVMSGAAAGPARGAARAVPGVPRSGR
ncbi:hypothetical protein V2S66_27680 [Streptomyces sp. V4-01]|uniref:Uncharacterized protein n=1 Tax=Actinacidiphila polyblastidii TaxID=3110430 RepID=A0ABU7PKZ6_9ACTN|nr:hypothetical protein [Streptomyces sp. V4-01]